MKPMLILKATPDKGVVFYHNDKPVRRFPKGHNVAPERHDIDSEEDFINICLKGEKAVPLQILNKMDLSERQQINTLHKRATKRITELKEEVARNWTGCIDKFKVPFKPVKMVTFQRSVLENIHIPLGIIYSEMLKLKQ